GGRLHDAELEPYGSPASWLGVKPAFRLDGEALVPLLGARSLVFLPPEAPGPLRPLLARWARERAGLPVLPGGVMLVRLDGAPARLYRFAAYLAEPPAETADEAPEADALARLPVPAGDLLAAYDALRARVEPLLLHDKTGAWPSREVRYRLRREREALEAWSRGPAAPGPATASRLLEPLDERLILNGNPAPSFVIGDLGPGAFRPPGARVTWTSSHPALIAPDGRVTRPERGPPARVRLEASVDREGAAAARPLHFTVIPRGTRLPLVRLRVPGEIPNTHRTPALAEFLDDDGVGRSGWLAAAVKLRGNTTLYHPKKSYSLRLDTRYRLPGFSGSSVVHLVGSQADPSLMKSKLAYDLFRSFGEPGRPRPSPRIELVELFVNDEYHGIYQLSERVDRFLLGFPAFDPREARQTVIYKAQGAEANLRTMVRRAYRQVEPDPRHGEYWTPLEELVALAGGAEPAAFTREVADRIDLPTFVDFHLLVNLFANREGVRFNLFLARDRAEGSRFVIVPWDYDKTVLGEPRGWLTNFLLLRLGKELPEYTEQLKRRWRELRRRQLADAAVLERIDGIEATLAPSLAREFARWPRATSHAETLREMKAWLPERLRYLDRRIAALTPG
ncbi:MAG TPA: CotH kinase family protein, partial [Methylomirabilota bacterium]|nr:CotH kinase family protein [Methylomirabilota bacterium]